LNWILARHLRADTLVLRKKGVRKVEKLSSDVSGGRAGGRGRHVARGKERI